MSDDSKAQQWQDQHEMFHVASPCIGVCTSGPKGYCRGCLRSRVERFHWHEMSDNQKFTVVKICQSRKSRILAAKKRKDVTQLQQDDMFAGVDDQLDLF